MELIFAVMTAVPLILTLALIVTAATMNIRVQPPEPAPKPGLPPDAAVEVWMERSPWRALALERGWRCTDLRAVSGDPAYRIQGEHLGQAFEAVSSLRMGQLHVAPDHLFIRQRLLLRVRTRRPPEGLGFRGSTLHWDYALATLEPFQLWLPEQAQTQALEWRGPHLELSLIGDAEPLPCLEQAMTLFRALRHAELPHWHGPPPGWTLSMDSTGLWPRLSGVFEGQAVHANLEWVQGALRTRIMAPLPPREPPFSLTHPDFAKGPGLRVGNPIVDNLLHASGDMEGLRAVFAQPGAVEATLAIVHGHPGSRLTQDRIELVAPGDLGEALAEALEKVRWAAACIRPAGT